MIIHLKIIGTLLIILTIFHAGFPKYFEWKDELKDLSLINRQMMKTHTFFIALVLLGIGFLAVFKSDELVNDVFGRFISLGFGVFWLLRLYFQLFVYSPKLWKGKKFETTVHIIFSMFWVYTAAIFLMIGLKG